MSEFVLENAVHDDRGQVALLEFQPDIRRIERVLDGDRNIVGEAQALELPDRALLQLLADAGIVPVGHALLQDLGAGLIAGVADGFRKAHQPSDPVFRLVGAQEGAAAAGAVEHAFIHQRRDGVADGDAADAKMPAEFGFRHQAAGLVDQFAVLDLAADGLADLNVKRQWNWPSRLAPHR